MSEQQHNDTDYAFSAVPASERKGFWSMLLILLGFTFFSASMWTGAELAAGLNLNGFLLAVAIGGAILGAYTGALGYIGAKTGLNFDLLCHRSFGAKGSFLPSAMIALTQIGWTGVGFAMFAYPIQAKFLPGSSIDCQATAVAVEQDMIAKAADSIVWTVAKGDSGWTVSNKDIGYLGYVAAGNSAGAEDKAGKNSSWTISGDEGLFLLANAGDSGRYLLYDSGTSRFACYETPAAGKPLAFYKKSADGAGFAKIKTLDGLEEGEYVITGATAEGEEHAMQSSRSNPLALWGMVIAIGLATTLATYYGVKGLEIVSWISVPLITVLGCYAMGKSIIDGGGMQAIFAKSAGNLSLLTAVGMVIGSFVSGGTATPNFVRFARPNAAIWTTVIAFFLGNTLMFFFGGVAGAFTGEKDIFFVMAAMGLMIPAILVLGANIWTTNDVALYTGSLGLSNLTKAPKRPMVLVAGALATVFALWLYNHFCDWLTILNATLPPVGAILVLDYFRHKDHYAENASAGRQVNWGSVVGVIGGATAGNLVHRGIPAITAMAIAAVCYLVTDILVPARKA